MSETMRTFALNGVASLDADGLIPDGQIPSSVGISGNALVITRARTA